jgi:hypothetical protein
MQRLVTLFAILATGALSACGPNATDSGAPTDAQIQAEIESLLTCAGRDDGFVTCTPPLTYSFGPIQRNGVGCISGAPGVKLPIYIINTTVQMTGNFSDGSARQFVEGATDQQTFFFRYSDYYKSWTASVGPVSDASPC